LENFSERLENAGAGLADSGGRSPCDATLPHQQEIATMYTEQNVTTGNRTRDREWALTQPREPAMQRSPAPRRARATGAGLAAPPELAVMGLTIGTALIVGTTAKATAALGSPHAMQLGGAEQMRRQALAVQAFQARQYPMAYGRFAELADAGDAPSALMALAMMRHGPTVFGSEWSITPGQVQRWSELALHEVREHGTAIAQHDRGE
jgi:hypothetical protein